MAIAVLEAEGILSDTQVEKGPTTMFGIGRHTTVHTGGKVSRASRTGPETEISKSKQERSTLSSTAKPRGIAKRPPKEHEKAGYVAGLLALVSPAASKPDGQGSQ